MRRLLNRLVTGRGAVRATYALSELLNRLTGGTRRASRRREENRAAAARCEASLPARINGQGRAPVARLPYGKYTMDYNGCEVIASYNALGELGAHAPLAEVAAEYERRGLFLAGLWGTHVEAIPPFFVRRGFAVRTLYAPAVRRPGACDAAFSKGRAAVLSFWNSAKRLRDGVHTVALAHGADGGLVVYNLGNLDRRENTDFRSIGELIQKRGILPILLVTIL